MEVVQVQENTDGSAEFQFDMTEPEADILFIKGLELLKEKPLEYTGEQYNEAREAVIKFALITGIVESVQKHEKAQTTTNQE